MIIPILYLIKPLNWCLLCISPSSISLFILGKNGVRGESGVSDDDLASDVLSHYSSASESASVIEEGTGTQTIKNMHKLSQI